MLRSAREELQTPGIFLSDRSTSCGGGPFFPNAITTDNRPLYHLLHRNWLLPRSLVRSSLVSVGLVLILPVCGPAVQVLYGPGFAGAIGPLRALIVVAMIDVFLTPVLLLAYHYNQPRVLASVDAARIVAFVALAVVLAPGLGLTGAVIARLGSRLVGVAIALIGVRQAGLVAAVTSE